MKTFKETLSEKYINLINNDPNKEKYIDIVWDLVYNAYSGIGGIKGSGFKNKQDMIDNIPFWKLLKKNDKIIGVFLYKDKGGRKRIATAIDGSDEARKALKDFYKHEFKRSFSEVSGASWGSIRKRVPMDELLSVVKTPEEASKILGNKGLVHIKDFDTSLDPEFKLKAGDPFESYYYARSINGHWHVKIMVGTTENFLKG